MNPDKLEALLLLVIGMSMVFFGDPISRVAQRLSMRAVGEKGNVNTIRALSLALILGVATRCRY